MARVFVAYELTVFGSQRSQGLRGGGFAGRTWQLAPQVAGAHGVPSLSHGDHRLGATALVSYGDDGSNCLPAAGRCARVCFGWPRPAIMVVTAALAAAESYMIRPRHSLIFCVLLCRRDGLRPLR